MSIRLIRLRAGEEEALDNQYEFGGTVAEFNSLMSEVDIDRGRWHQEKMALEALVEARKNAIPADTEVSDIAYLYSEVDRLRAELSEERVKAVMREIYARYPLVSTVPELVTGDTVEELWLSAADISYRLGGFEYGDAVRSILGLRSAVETDIDATS